MAYNTSDFEINETIDVLLLFIACHDYLLIYFKIYKQYFNNIIMSLTQQNKIVLNSQLFPLTSQIENITESIFNFKHRNWLNKIFNYSALWFILWTSAAFYLVNIVHLIWFIDLSNLAKFLEHFGNIPVITNEVLRNYRFFFILLRFLTTST